MPNIGVWEIVIVVVIALLIFGPKKLPELGSSLGRSITGFKKGLKDSGEEVKAAMKEDATADAKGGNVATASTATATATTATATATETPAVAEASPETQAETTTV
jgi:sec-independent protein translocase protein TatA